MTLEEVLTAIPRDGIAIKRLRLALGLNKHKPNDELDTILFNAREKGLVSFDINSGLWTRKDQ